MKIATIPLADIIDDYQTQQRENLKIDIINEYAEALRCGAKFPPVVVFHDGATYHLADGFHRLNACRQVEGLKTVEAEVRSGSIRDARLYSASANATHGMRLTNADKRRSVLVLLTDDEWRKWTDTAIAKHCHVTQQYVYKVRKEITDSDNHSPKKTRVSVYNNCKKTPTSENGSAPANGSESGVDTSSQVREETQQENGSIDPETGEFVSDLDYQKALTRQMAESLAAQQEKMDALIIRQAVSVMDIPEDERIDVIQTIEGLKAEVKTLTAALDAATESRDAYMRENAQMRKQIASQSRMLSKFNGAQHA